MTGSESLTKFSGEGFSNLKHVVEKLVQHEISKNHLDVVNVFSCRSPAVNSVHHKLKQQVTFLYMPLSIYMEIKKLGLSVA